MAVATATATTYNLQPRSSSYGPTQTYGTIVLSARTVSDIVFLCKVPNKATITNWWVRGSTPETLSCYKLGITGTGGTETTFGTHSLSTADDPTLISAFGALRGRGLGHKVSISDTDAQSGATIYMTLSTGTWTTSVSIDFMFEWSIDGLAK